MPTDKTEPLIEGKDYTVDHGRWVFTAAYLLRRGTCCGNGCQNCPYRTQAQPALAHGTADPLQPEIKRLPIRR